MQILIKIRDQDGDSNFDSFVVAPPGMRADESSALVAENIVTAKAANPETYVWEDLMALILPLGFTRINWVVCQEAW